VQWSFSWGKGYGWAATMVFSFANRVYHFSCLATKVIKEDASPQLSRQLLLIAEQWQASLAPKERERIQLAAGLKLV
jgi:hypothetical protein